MTWLGRGIIRWREPRPSLDLQFRIRLASRGIAHPLRLARRVAWALGKMIISLASSILMLLLD